MLETSGRSVNDGSGSAYKVSQDIYRSFCTGNATLASAGMLERFFFDVPMPKLMSGEMHNNKFKAIKSLFSIGY